MADAKHRLSELITNVETLQARVVSRGTDTRPPC